MDRELIVKKDGYALGEILFKYQTKTGGSVNILVNKIVDLEHGLKMVIPLYRREIEFSHDEFNAIDAVTAFDKTYFYEQPDPEKQFDGDLEFTYPPIHYRYAINGGGTGIADIHADFLANKKNLRFISTSSIKSDHNLSSNSLETNVALLTRLCAVPKLNCQGVEFGLADHKWE